MLTSIKNFNDKLFKVKAKNIIQSIQNYTTEAQPNFATFCGAINVLPLASSPLLLTILMQLVLLMHPLIAENFVKMI